MEFNNLNKEVKILFPIYSSKKQREILVKLVEFILQENP